MCTLCTTAENGPEKNPAAAAFLSSADIRPAAFFSGGFSAPSTFWAAAAKFGGWGSTWMGDPQERPSAVNLSSFVGVDRNL